MKCTQFFSNFTEDKIKNILVFAPNDFDWLDKSYVKLFK